MFNCRTCETKRSAMSSLYYIMSLRPAQTLTQNKKLNRAPRFSGHPVVGGLPSISKALVQFPAPQKNKGQMNSGLSILNSIVFCSIVGPVLRVYIHTLSAMEVPLFNPSSSGWKRSSSSISALSVIASKTRSFLSKIKESELPRCTDTDMDRSGRE